MSYPRNMTGEEAFAARSLMTPLSFEEKWLHDLFEAKENIPPEPTLQKREAVEQGELPDERSPSAPVLRSQASSTLYSIPQWQPPPCTRPETSSRGGNGPLSRPPLPDPNRSFWQDPRHWGVTSTRIARPVEDRRGYRSRNVANTPHMGLPTDIQQHDKLDQWISVRPRGKTSAEVQFVLHPEFSDASIRPFPHAMLVIVHQFMVANKFVSPRQHLGKTEKKNLWESLLVRLDLHESDDLSRQQNKRLKRAAERLNYHVDDQSKEWLAAGVYLRSSKKLPPAFHTCTQPWLRRDWDGVMISPTHTTTIGPAMYRTIVQSEFNTAKTQERVPSIGSLVPEQSTNVRAEAVNVTNEAYETRHISTSSRERKRRASDRADAPAPKRLRERLPTLADRYLKSPLSVLDEHADIQFVRPHDKGFPTILDNIRHAHHTLEELAPKSAKDLAALQQDWADHGFPSLLTESLFAAQSYTLSMKMYLDNALDLLLLLEDCTSWKVDGENFELELEHENPAMQSGSS